MAFNPSLLQSADFSSIDYQIGKHRIDVDDNHYLIAEIQSDDIGADFYWNLKWAPNDGQRPHGFTGAAVKVAHECGQALWFEPEREGRTVYNDKQTIKAVKEAIEYGYAYVCLTLYGPAVDAYGATHFVDIASASCGGAPWEASAVQSILTELAQEITGQIVERESELVTA